MLIYLLGRVQVCSSNSDSRTWSLMSSGLFSFPLLSSLIFSSKPGLFPMQEDDAFPWSFESSRFPYGKLLGGKHILPMGFRKSIHTSVPSHEFVMCFSRLETNDHRFFRWPFIWKLWGKLLHMANSAGLFPRHHSLSLFNGERPISIGR